MVSVHRHVAVIHSMIERDEQSIEWIAANRVARNHEGALLLTARRMLWSGLGVLTQSQEAFPLADIAAIVLEAETKPAKLTIDCNGETEVFTGKPADFVRMHAALLTAWAPYGAQRAALPASLIGELERLARLRDSGALSPTEFASAKQQLLG